MGRRALLVVLLLVPALAGCELIEPPPRAERVAPVPGKAPPRADLVFPVNDPATVGMDALLQGRLVRRGRCLYVTAGGHETLPVWPHGYTFREEGPEVSVLDGDSRVIARTGKRISMGGGLISEPGRPIPESLRSRVAGCRHDNVWIVNPF